MITCMLNIILNDVHNVNSYLNPVHQFCAKNPLFILHFHVSKIVRLNYVINETTIFIGFTIKNTKIFLSVDIFMVIKLRLWKVTY